MAKNSVVAFSLLFSICWIECKLRRSRQANMEIQKKYLMFKIIWKYGSSRNKENLQYKKTADSVSTMSSLKTNNELVEIW